MGQLELLKAQLELLKGYARTSTGLQSRLASMQQDIANWFQQQQQSHHNKPLVALKFDQIELPANSMSRSADGHAPERALPAAGRRRGVAQWGGVG